LVRLRAQMYVAIMSQQAARMARAAQEGRNETLEMLVWCARL
jgi:hypothetical protein